jgi:hypothetical protein
MRYLGPPFVYGIERIGKTVGSLGLTRLRSGNTAVWLSEVRVLDLRWIDKPIAMRCVSDVTDNINRVQQQRCLADTTLSSVKCGSSTHHQIN